MNISSWDDRRDYIVLPSTEEAVRFAKENWLHIAARSIQQKGRFAVALSGGSTPKAIYQLLAAEEKPLIAKGTPTIAWEQLLLFFSDERGVPPTHPDSNYKMAMESGFDALPIPKGQIFRMEAESAIEKNALAYEEKIHHFLDKSLFDLVMLGMGEDGHTASLFPGTEALQIQDRLVCPNFLPLKKSWRMTLTFSCIEKSSHVAIYALGAAKKEMVAKVLKAPILSPYPASRIGSHEHKALWILDSDAASLL